jgi:hypothetical protein
MAQENEGGGRASGASLTDEQKREAMRARLREIRAARASRPGGVRPASNEVPRTRPAGINTTPSTIGTGRRFRR